MPRTLKLDIAYDGTELRRLAAPDRTRIGIQQVLEDEIAAIVGAHNPLNAAGRTDAGVHAAAQVASITIDHPIPADELLRALNARLKAGDIRIRSIDEMPDRWDARIYREGARPIATRSGTAPRRARSSATSSGTCRSRSISIACSVRTAALVGEHDFAAFQGRGTDVQTTVRRVHRRRTSSR